jgi:hypothetical protein
MLLLTAAGLPQARLRVLLLTLAVPWKWTFGELELAVFFNCQDNRVIQILGSNLM